LPNLPSWPRLYAIVDAELAAARGVAPERLVGVWLDAGVRLFQLRAKTLTDEEFLRLAERFAIAARAAGAMFIVNDRIEIARASGAAGVHLGQEDEPPAEARARLGASAIVGWSTHNDAQIGAAAAAPVDYFAIGPVFPTGSKAQPDPIVGLDGVREAARYARASDKRLVAIGGITLDRARAVMAAGADAVAVISDLVAGDPVARCRQYLKTLQTV
jgi:thiamine-phosphate pyrophosphorylase